MLDLRPKSTVSAASRPCWPWRSAWRLAARRARPRRRRAPGARRGDGARRRPCAATSRTRCAIFKGVPYAQPRGRPAALAAAAAGARPGPACGTPRPSAPTACRTGWRWDDTQTKLPVSEDCLTLNVWTPASAATKRAGDGLDPRRRLRHGLGQPAGVRRRGPGRARRGGGDLQLPPGPLRLLRPPGHRRRASPTSRTATTAFMDQMAALTWVQAQHRRPRGRSGRVTIFGPVGRRRLGQPADADPAGPRPVPAGHRPSRAAAATSGRS